MKLKPTKAQQIALLNIYYHCDLGISYLAFRRLAILAFVDWATIQAFSGCLDTRSKRYCRPAFSTGMIIR